MHYSTLENQVAQSGVFVTLEGAMSKIIKEEIQENDQLLIEAQYALKKIITSKELPGELIDLIEVIIIILDNHQTIHKEQHRRLQ